MGRRIFGSDRQLDQVQASLAELEASVARVAERLDRHIEDTTHRFHRLFQVLERMADDEVGNRRRLVAARREPSYEAAYEEADPLVSVLIPTYSNAEGLRERSLPSVLAQTHGNLELIVVGDAAVPDVEEVVRGFDDPRVRWRNREVRGPYPDERELLWLVSGVPPWNDALELARGRWIAPFSDDDALRPDAIGSVLESARSRRLELCYGALEMHEREGGVRRLGEFPPAPYAMGLQGSVFHGSLRFLQHQLIDALFGVPSDWSLVRRMLRIGVRIGYLDQVVCDYYPSYRAAAEAG
jgi:hypothetical protein